MRERLPNRRRNETALLQWQIDDGPPVRVYVCAGAAEDGRIMEVFLRGSSRTVQDFDHLLDDIAVLASRCLQHGDTPEDLRRAVGRHPGGRPSSIVGAAIDTLRGDGAKAG
jgi:hypothetical protein